MQMGFGTVTLVVMLLHIITLPWKMIVIISLIFTNCFELQMMEEPEEDSQYPSLYFVYE